MGERIGGEHFPRIDVRRKGCAKQANIDMAGRVQGRSPEDTDHLRATNILLGKLLVIVKRHHSK